MIVVTPVLVKNSLLAKCNVLIEANLSDPNHLSLYYNNCTLVVYKRMKIFGMFYFHVSMHVLSSLLAIFKAVLYTFPIYITE